VDLKGFRAQTAEGKRLSQSRIDAPALVDRESDVLGPLPMKVGPDGQSLEFECAAHSVSFVVLTAPTN
jgi:hypothetical protein